MNDSGLVGSRKRQNYVIDVLRSILADKQRQIALY